MQCAVDQIAYGGQEITQEKDLCVAAIAVVAPVKVVALFAVIATIAFNCMVFISGSCYQSSSGSVVTSTWQSGLAITPCKQTGPLESHYKQSDIKKLP